MASKDRFSRRHGFSSSLQPDELIRDDAPEAVRAALLGAARDAGLRPSTLRKIACKILNRFPNDNNWSEFPNIWEEVQGLVRECPWFRVYDLIEALHHELLKHGSDSHEMIGVPTRKLAKQFAASLNVCMEEEGIGWQLTDGEVTTRGSEAFEAQVHHARDLLDETDRATASGEIHEALMDLSRRPKPDLTGATQHAIAALECVARDVCGDTKATLGDVLRRNPDLLPSPLKVAVEKVWGYSSEMGRHLREGREPQREEAELVVGLAASVITYLIAKNRPR